MICWFLSDPRIFHAGEDLSQGRELTSSARKEHHTFVGRGATYGSSTNNLSVSASIRMVLVAAYGDPKIAARRSNIEAYLLPDRVRSIDDAPDPLFTTDVDHLFPR
jgi:hypothetical protein